MSDWYQDLEDVDQDEELDLLVGGDAPDDEIRESQRALAISAVDEEAVAFTSRDVPEHPGLRSLFDRAVRLALLEGDKNGTVADLCNDIIAELRVLMLEMTRDPSYLLLACLGTLSEEEQLDQMSKLIQLLVHRSHAIILEV